MSSDPDPSNRSASLRVGIFGGTFDPPHVGHLILADLACFQLHLDHLLWVLTAGPPHKRGRDISAVGDRLALLQAALLDNPQFELSRIDIDRPAPHYAVDTVRLLRQVYPRATLVYLMGGDSLRDLPTWHTPQAFIQACDAIGVMRRPGATIDLDQLEQQLPGLTEKVQFIRAPLIEISASEIRQRVAENRPYRYFLLPEVFTLVQSLRLYQDSNSH